MEVLGADHDVSTPRLHRPAALALVGMLTLGGCIAPSEAAQAAIAEGLDPDKIVDLGDAAVGAEWEGPRLTVTLVVADGDRDWQVTELGSGEAVPGADSYFMVTGSGTGLAWNTFIYGTASPGVASVSVSGLSGVRGGTVADGVWVIASPDENAELESLRVQFNHGSAES